MKLGTYQFGDSDDSITFSTDDHEDDATYITWSTNNTGATVSDEGVLNVKGVAYGTEITITATGLGALEGAEEATLMVTMLKESYHSWGDSDNCGDNSQIEGLTDVKTIYSTEGAFAALKDDGTVFVWGMSSYGGDNSQLEELADVKTIYSTAYAFVAEYLK